MSEYSKEYLESQGFFKGYDFSILEVFESLQEGEYLPIICEGFGCVGVMKEDGVCKLIFNNPDRVVPLFEVLGTSVN